jgi:hypothetical protein
MFTRIFLGQKMANNGSKFESMALLLASGSSIKAASQSVGVSVRQGYRIASSDKMRSRIGELRSQITNEAVGLITTAATQASSTLRSLLDESNPPAVRLNAAKAVLASLSAISELGELRARIDALESKQCQV